MKAHADTEIRPPALDWKDTNARICEFLDHALENAHAHGFVLGLSGGVDSAVVAHLAAQKHADKTRAILMPDGMVTPDTETDDGRLVAESLNIRCDDIPLDGVMAAYSTILGDEKRAMGNLRARTRAAILYHYANSENLLVLGSTDYSEHMIGYYTKFGDGAADITPIATLYKTQVRKFAKHLGVPDHIATKKSSPHLWPGHDAEAELGASYHDIDCILYGVMQVGISPQECAKCIGTDIQTVHHIIDMVNKNRHKAAGPLRPSEV